MDDYVLDKVDVTPEGGHGVEQGDIQAWKNKRNEWIQSMMFMVEEEQE
jgi:hypothetical protein